MGASARLIAAMCAAEVLTMAGVFAFPALLPTFVAEWTLSNTQAGWIAGVYFGAYALAAPVLVALTDRIDAKIVYIGGALMAAATSAGFALGAQGFWSALALRALAGTALAATYMPGLKVLVDRYRGPNQSRAVAFYTSSFSFGTAFSFLMAGEMFAAFGWHSAFAAAASAGAMAAAMASVLPPAKPEASEAPAQALDVRPVFANRAAMSYVLGYGVHCWELFTLRSWQVALLAFSLTRQPGEGSGWPSPTAVATIGSLVAMAASFGGNEMCVRFGRCPVIQRVMAASALMACGIGFAASLPYGAVVALVLLYNAAVLLDSAALTAGAVEAASSGRRGATMAVHSLIGFGCAAIGPLVFGAVLDLLGGATTPVSWGVAFASVGLIGTLGPLALRQAGARGG